MLQWPVMNWAITWGCCDRKVRTLLTVALCWCGGSLALLIASRAVMEDGAWSYIVTILQPGDTECRLRDLRVECSDQIKWEWWKSREDYWCFDAVTTTTLHFKGHFPGGPGLVGTRMSPFWISLEDDRGGDDNWSYKTCKASVRSFPTTPWAVLQAGCPSCHRTNSVRAVTGTE